MEISLVLSLHVWAQGGNELLQRASQRKERNTWVGDQCLPLGRSQRDKEMGRKRCSLRVLREQQLERRKLSQGENGEAES